MFTRRMVRGFALAAVAALTTATALATSSSGAPTTAAPPPTPAVGDVTQLNVARPRILLRAADIPVVDRRLARAPYSTLLQRMDTEIAQAAPPSAADQANCGLSANIGREEGKARAAKDLSFMYAVNRIWDSTTRRAAVPTTTQRTALGDLARDYLVDTCTTSRIHVDPDRDINTSNEMIQMATAYDTLAGANYPFAATGAVIIGNLVAWTTQFYGDYQPFLAFLTNNHLAKGAASIGTMAIALAGSPGVDNAELDTWLDFAMTNVQQVVRYTEGSGDGTYGEGPFYWRYASENVVPFARAFDQVGRGRAWQTRTGVVVDDIWTATWFTDIGRWELDMTQPDGTVAPFDDSNVDDAYFFGALPSTDPNAGAYAWRWANTASTSASVPYESTGNVDLAADEIVTFNDHVKATPPTESPNRLGAAGGDLVFRSDWTKSGVVAFVQAEHGGSRGFGRAPGRAGVAFAAVHDHADPGSFLLDAYGERLLLDPGYVNYTWTQHGVLSNPSAHNLVLVGPATDPESPGNPNSASTLGSSQLSAFTTSPTAPVPVDGEAYATATLDTPDVAAATVTSVYGRSPSYVAPAALHGRDYQELATADSAIVQRRFLFVDRQYLVIADAVLSRTPRSFTWPLHGNGGGTTGMTDPQPALSVNQRGFEPASAIPATPYQASGGTFTQTAAGGEWARTQARVDTGMAFDSPTAPTTSVTQGLYEQTHDQLGSDAVLSTSMTSASMHAASVIYPTPTTGVAPTITRLTIAGVAVLRVDDPARNHHVLVVVQAPGRPVVSLPCTTTGMPVSITTNAAFAVVDVHANGTTVTNYSEQGSRLTIAQPTAQQRGLCPNTRR